MTKLRRFLVVGVMVLSVVAMSGLVVAPVKAAASAGDLIKMSGNSAVYYLGADGKRYVFPNPATYNSWYNDFSGVVTIPSSELQSYPLGANVAMRPGTSLVKITTDPSVYAVEPNGVLRKIQSEAQAAALYGSNWNKRIVDVPDYLFTNYTVGQPLPSGQFPIGSLVKNASASTIYYYDGTNYREIANESAFNANRFKFANVLTTTSTITAGGGQVANAEFVNVAQSGGGSVITGSGLMVSLNATTPAAASVPRGAVNVPFTKVNLTAAADGPVTLNTVAFTRTGVGAAGDFANVYLYDGATRLTTGRSVNSSTNKVTFTGLNYTIPAGMTKTLTLTADISSTQGNNNAFGIAAASDITSTGANVSGSFPVTGNVMNIVAQTTGGITIAKTGSPSNPKVGETNVLVAQFTLAASSVEDLSLQGLTLYQAGTVANSNVSNFVLKQAGTTVATAASVDSKNNITFTFNAPFNLDKGVTKTFDVYADINGLAKSGDKIRLYLDNGADLYAMGKTYGYGVAVTRTAYDGSGVAYSEVELQAGQMTIAFQGPATSDYATQQTGVELFRFNMTSQSNVEIRRMQLTLDAASTGATTTGRLINSTASTANYTNIKFVDATTGALIAGPMDVSTSGSDETQTLSFTDVWNMSAAQTKTIKVISDIANFTPGSTLETIKATLVAFGSTDIKNLDNNTFVTGVVPSGNVIGNTMNVKSGSVVLSKAGTPTLQTYINGSSAVPMTGINITAGSGKDIRVTSIKVTAVGANSCGTETDCVLTVKLYDGATQVGDTKSLASDMTATFNNLTINVAKGTTKTIVAKVDLNTLSSVAGGTTLAINVTSTDDVTAQDANGNAVGVSGTISGSAQVITTAGTLTVAKSADVIGSTDARLVVAGNVDQPIASFKFTAQNEALKLTKVRIKVQKENAAGATSSAASEIANISLWNGSTQIASAAVPSTSGNFAVADFSSTLSDFVVAKDASADLLVKVSYNTISGGATSGAKLKAYLDASTNFEFRGVNSNTVLTDVNSSVDVGGNYVYLYKSIPTVTNVALPTTVLTAGNSVLAKFTVAADSRGNISWRSAKFDVSVSNATATTFTLVDESNNSVGTCTASPTSITATGTVSCVQASTENQVSAGTTKTYSLKADMTVGTNSASVSTKINRTASFADPTTYSASYFSWSDESVVGHAYDSADYNNDFLVKNLPTDSQTLSK